MLFCVKKTPKTTKNTPNLQIQKENNKKSNEIRKQRLDDVINNDNNVANIDNIGNSMNRHMQQIDHQTGEVVEGFVAYVVPKRKTDFRKDGWQWLKEAMMMLAQSNLTGNDMKVMWQCLPGLTMKNLIQVNQAEVSEQVGMNRHNVKPFNPRS